MCCSVCVLLHACVLCGMRVCVCGCQRHGQARRPGEALLGPGVKQTRRRPEAAEDPPRNIFVSFYAFSKETKEVVCTRVRVCVCLFVFIPFGKHQSPTKEFILLLCSGTKW